MSFVVFTSTDEKMSRKKRECAIYVDLMGLLKNKRGNAVLVNCTSKIHNYRLIRIVDRRNGRRGNCT